MRPGLLARLDRPARWLLIPALAGASPWIPAELRWPLIAPAALAGLCAALGPGRPAPIRLLTALGAGLLAAALALSPTWALISGALGALLQFAGHSAGLQWAQRLQLVPIHVITGCLGSGKTTLINRLLGDPALADTAVIVNEFGEIGLDHLLLEAVDERMMLLESGCVCCTVRGDLLQTLYDLRRRALRGEIAPFRRVLVETTGLADPAPILQTLLASRRLSAWCRLGAVITVVDAQRPDQLRPLSGDDPGHLAAAHSQVAFADRLVLSKLDLGADHRPAVEAALRRLNPEAPILTADAIEQMLAPVSAPASAPRHPEASSAAHEHDHGHDHGHAHGDVQSLSLRCPEPIPAATLQRWLDALVEAYGPDLLRVKGLVEIAERPGRPAQIHAVQHMIAPLRWLDAWPDASTDGRVVLIGYGLDRQLIEGWLWPRRASGNP